LTDDDGARKRERRIRLAVTVGGLLLRLLGWTWRPRVHGGDQLARLRNEREPIIFCLWHGELLPLLWQHRGEGVAVLISEHHDGEIMARTAHGLGFRTIRGSTSRGAGRALIALIRHLEGGGDVAITPDGPRGPRGEFAPGAAVAAQRAGATLLLTRAVVRRAWRLKSWDRFIIPKPFARIEVWYRAIRVDAATARDAADEAPRLGRLLDETVPGSEVTAG
jgi:Kdo2-lipid IVA 3' secondary acyltransferase